jgi:GT2 family glycosyltransferase
MSMETQVSIVIVNYNTRDYTAQCLDSIRAAQLGVTYEIVVVDNASHGGDADWLEAHYPEIQLVRSPENRGIAGGNNMGIRASCGKYTLLLNNDTLVYPGSIEAAVAFLHQHPEAAGVGGNLLNEDGSFQSGHADFPSLWDEFLFVTHLGPVFNPHFPFHPRGQQTLEVDWMSTAFMLFRRDALDQVDHMDEDYFIYSDETDLQYRLKKAHWKIYYLPDLETIHFFGKSLTPWRRRRMMYRGKMLFFSKHYGRTRATMLRLMFGTFSVAKALAWGLVSLARARHERAMLELNSHLDVLRVSVHLK